MEGKRTCTSFLPAHATELLRPRFSVSNLPNYRRVLVARVSAITTRPFETCGKMFSRLFRYSFEDSLREIVDWMSNMEVEK